MNTLMSFVIYVFSLKARAAHYVSAFRFHFFVSLVEMKKITAYSARPYFTSAREQYFSCRALQMCFMKLTTAGSINTDKIRPDGLRYKLNSVTL